LFHEQLHHTGLLRIVTNSLRTLGARPQLPHVTQQESLPPPSSAPVTPRPTYPMFALCGTRRPPPRQGSAQSSYRRPGRVRHPTTPEPDKSHSFYRGLCRTRHEPSHRPSAMSACGYQAAREGGRGPVACLSGAGPYCCAPSHWLRCRQSEAIRPALYRTPEASCLGARRAGLRPVVQSGCCQAGA
jgi:hypothetical protein